MRSRWHKRQHWSRQIRSSLMSSDKLLPIPYSDIFPTLWSIIFTNCDKPSGTLILITNYVRYFPNSVTSHPYTNQWSNYRLFIGHITFPLFTHTFIFYTGQTTVKPSGRSGPMHWKFTHTYLIKINPPTPVTTVNVFNNNWTHFN